LRYFVAETVDQAVARIGDGAIPIAGGTVLTPKLSGGMPANSIVDIGRIKSLREIDVGPGAINLGATVTMAQAALALSPQGSDRAAYEATHVIGNPNVRRAATLGGNLSALDQVRDLTTALVVLDARVRFAHAGGTDEVSIEDFLGLAASPARLLTAISIPFVPQRRSSFIKFAWRQASARAIFNVAAAARVVDGRLHGVRIAVGGITNSPVRAREAELALEEQAPDRDRIANAARLCAERTPIDIAPAFSDSGYVRSALRCVVEEVISALGVGGS
jgi:aerobic carbon-monoxide dehydrogenase medium subunit